VYKPSLGWVPMLSWFRARIRSISAAAFVSVVALTLSSSAPHEDDCHGPGCGVSLPHDPSGHAVGRDSGSTDHPLHCVLCHWTRVVRPPADSAQPLSSTVEVAPRTFVDIQRAPQHVPTAQPPLRAPPASPSLA
jgi:hypothetical protein